MPAHRSDFGIFQQAEVLGMSQVIYVKDEDGMYDKVVLRDDLTWSDGKQYPGVVVQEGGGQYFVRMESGEQHWIAPAYVHFDRTDGTS